MISVGDLLYRFDVDGSLIRLQVVKRGPKETTIELRDYEHGTARWPNESLDSRIAAGLIFPAEDIERGRELQLAMIDQRTATWTDRKPSGWERVVAGQMEQRGRVEAASIEAV